MRQILAAALFCSVSADIEVGNLQETPLIETVGTILSQTKIGDIGDASLFDGTSAIMRAMGHLPRPISPFRSKAIDPSVLHENSCDRDFGVLCPDGFLSIGNVKGDGKEYCFASPSYDGPCSSDAYAFEGLSSTAKGRWSEKCKAAWPCKRKTKRTSVPKVTLPRI